MTGSGGDQRLTGKRSSESARKARLLLELKRFEQQQRREARLLRLKALAAAERALELGDPSGVAHHLRETPDLDRNIVLRLAEMLEPSDDGDPTWRLRFERRRAGNPGNKLETEVNLILLAVKAEGLHARACSFRCLNKAALRKRVNGHIADRYGVSDAQVEAALKLYRKRKRELLLG
jgi:hypothetical protein